MIGFSQTTYDVTEPSNEDDVAIVELTIARTGDATKESVIRFYTKDGNGESGKDYNPVSKGNNPPLYTAVQYGNNKFIKV